MSSALEPVVGQILAEKYRLTKLLGRGGMGSVWEGLHISLGTRVAVKFIDPEFGKQAELRERFVNEALAAARLQSKHIVQVIDHDLTEDGAPYIVMEYLSGEPLDARLEREGALGLDEMSPLLQQLCRAMHRAHSAGIVHRDLKPDNVFLVWDEEDRRDVVKVVDFGIAKFSEGTGIDSKTTTGAVLGTPHYMSPEQARGLPGVDARSDVWSIGVIAYRSVTGVLPFDGQALGDLLVKICTQEPVRVSGLVPVPRGFDEWVSRSLAKEPELRFASAEEQGRALAQLSRPGGEPFSTAAHSPKPVELFEPRARRRSANPLWAVLGLGCIGALGTTAWFFTRVPAALSDAPDSVTQDPEPDATPTSSGPEPAVSPAPGSAE
ncbi:MAG: hypothetical protein RJA70_4826, partial [Pseudomonadota bacterium]